MHSTQNWFGISKRRPRRDWGGEGWERGEEARMDTEKSRVKEEEHRDSEKDTGKEVETEKGRQGKPKKQNPPTQKKQPREKY